MSDHDDALPTLLGRSLGRRVVILRRTPLGGGSINQTERVDTDAGPFVVKSNPRAPAGFFEAEAAGLRALGASGTSLRIPRVIACSSVQPTCLVLEYLESGGRTHDFDERLGRGLAEVHRAASDRFGFDHDNFCGATPQPNPWTERWVDFYASARLGEQIGRAGDAGRLSVADQAVFARLLERLPAMIDEPATGPALIHGDLWSGNLHVGPDGTPALIDPSVCYAHREAELGMMTLFGGFSSRVFAAYDEAFPLEAGWQERQGLYQLYHLLNHLNLFGHGYHAQVMAVARRYT